VHGGDMEDAGRDESGFGEACGTGVEGGGFWVNLIFLEPKL